MFSVNYSKSKPHSLAKSQELIIVLDISWRGHNNISKKCVILMYFTLYLYFSEDPPENHQDQKTPPKI